MNERPVPVATATALRERLERLSPEQRAFVERRLAREAGPADVVGRRADRTRAPLSPAQEVLWRLEAVEDSSGAYNVPRAIWLRGELDRPALQSALDLLAARHPVLRSAVEATAETVEHVVRAAQTIPLWYDDVEALPPSEREGAAVARLERAAAAPFDLANGPLVRGALVRLGSREHAFALVRHHLASDAASGEILWREFAAAYDAYRSGSMPVLPEPQRDFGDFAAWQRGPGAGRTEALTAHWREELAGAPALPDLPFDRPRPAVPRFEGARCTTLVARAAADALFALGRRCGATPFMTLGAVFQALLFRYTGQDEIVLGSPVTGRGRPELEGVVGFFASVVPLRIRFEPATTFAGLLGQVRATYLRALDHADVPFDAVAAALPMGRPFHVTFSLAEAPAPLTLAGLVAAPLALERGSAKFDLSLGALLEPDGLRLVLEYRTDLFEAATVSRLLEHFVVLLDAAVAAPDVPVAKLPLMSGAERNRVLDAGNGTETAYAVAFGLADPTLLDLFDRAAALEPAADAVVAGDVTLSYAELQARVRRLSAALRAAGVGPGTRAAVYLRRGADLLPALLAVLEAGAAYVPLDPAYPLERLAFMVRDAGAAVVLTSELLASSAAEICTAAARGAGPERASVVVVDRLAPESDGASPAAPAARPRGDAPAYVMYTSGSTGTPKGAVVTHAGLANYLAWCVGAYEIRAGCGAPLHSSISFDLTVTSLFAPLVAGRAVFVLPEDDGPHALVAALRAQRTYSFVKVTPAHLELLRGELDGPLGPSLELSERMRYCIVGGELLLGEQLTWWQLHAPGTVFVNEYGPTETVVGCCAEYVRPGTAVRGRVPIGLPIGNTTAYVLDGNLEPVPPGIPGELYVGGAGVGLGYLNRDDETRAAFVSDPFARRVGARLYKTGDRVRRLPDGRLDYLGRIDLQIKLRGYRIEPAEIEAALLAQPDVRAAAVLVRADAAARPRLTAYCVFEPVPAGVAPGGVGTLRERLKRVLPVHMLPEDVVPLEALPLSANGKVDRAALLRFAVPEMRPAYRPPEGPVESALAALYADVLERDRIGRDDDFFELGGTSLSAMRLAMRVAGVLGFRPALRMLFEASTPAALAAMQAPGLGGDAPLRRPGLTAEDTPFGAGRASAGSAGTDTPPLPEAVCRYPLTPAQRPLWVFEQRTPGTQTYNVPLAVRLGGSLDAAALQAAFCEVVARHDALRTVFVEDAGEPWAVVTDGAEVPFECYDCSRAAAPEAAARERLRQEAARPFDLAAGPLVRAALVALGADVHVLLVVVHHIVFDGASAGVLLGELAAAYAEVRPGGARLARAPASYADFARRQARALTGERLRQLQCYWEAALSGAPTALALPTDRPRGDRDEAEGARRSTLLPKALAEAVYRLGRERHVTPFTILLTALGGLLQRYSGQNDVLVAVPVSSRDEATAPLVGLVATTLALRIASEPGQTFAALLERVRTTCLAAFEHAQLPFEALQARSADGTPLPAPAVLFAVQDAVLAPLSFGDARLEPVDVERAGAAFDLAFSVSERADGLRLAVRYRSALFDAATIDRLLAHFATLLRDAVERPDAEVARLTLLEPAQRDALLALGNRTAAAYPREASLVELIERRASTAPAAVAVEAADEALTYAGLVARASALAANLRRHGVERGSTVGVCLERSLALPVALLAVLKTGAAYVPLDPGFGRGRVAHALEDAGARLVLTDAAFEPFARDVAADVAAAAPGRRPPAVVRLENAGELGRPAAPSGPGAELVSARPPEDAPAADATAYVLFTSGSTGRPKGVPVSHRSLVNFLWSMAREPGFEAHDRLLAVTTLAFDIAGLELWLPLVAGGCVVLASQADAVDGARLAALLASSRATVLQATPATWRLLLGSGWNGGSGLRMLCGGEALPPDLATELLARGGELWNMYGPTETTIWSAVDRVLPGRAIRLGRAIANTQLYVLDPVLEPAPLGVPGELTIGGDGVAGGYLDRPELTAERFVPDPFRNVPGARLYRTGDLARRRADGSLEFLGRVDEQVKLRGFRIEPGEIEAALLATGEVARAVVVLRQDDGEPRLVAYCVPAAGATGTGDSVLSRLSDRLPAYMLPAYLVLMPALPTTPNGKLDRAALPPPGRAETASGGNPPQSLVEVELGGLWDAVLGRAAGTARREDDFFAAGGHSLLAMRLLGRAARRFAVDVRLADFFRARTLAGLAGLVERALEAVALGAAAEGDLLAEIAALSDDEALSLLQQEAGVSG